MPRTARFILFLAFLPFALLAQSQWATLTGQITDASGALVAGADIEIVNIATGEKYSASSNASGNYTIPLVKPGAYSLSAGHSGFKRYTGSGIVLETGLAARSDVRLEVGAVTESVTVDATLPLLQSESAAVGSVVENHSIVNMPLIDRRAAQLVKLSGFVASRGSGSIFSAAGGRSDNTSWIADGATVQNNVLGIPNLQFDAPIESLQEFNFAITTFAAELGRTGGAVVQMTTKSGTNQFHGSAYEFIRNDAFDARTFFAATKPVLRYNLFGASLGGPIIRNRTHFFFNYEGQRQNTQTTRILNVPDPAETRGDFSRNPIVVRDPAAAGRPPFAGNVIPAARLDPIGAQLALYYPAPNVPGRPSGNSNFRINQPQKDPQNSYVARVDHGFNSSNRVYGRMLVNFWNTQRGVVFPVKGTDQFGSSLVRKYWNISGTWLRNLTPRAVNEFRFGWDKRQFFTDSFGTGAGLGEKLNIPGVDKQRFPQIQVVGFTGLGYNGVESTQNPLLQTSVVDNVTYVRGNHTFKAGGEWRNAHVNNFNQPSRGGLFNFSNTATGNSMAALLLGWSDRAVRDDGALIRPHTMALGFFVQDDWKITPRLTINAGLRWDYDQPRWEEDNRQNSFDRFAINPVSGTPGVVAFSGLNGRSRYAHGSDWNNFGPRFGFAWRLRDKWVVRGGAGIIYLGQYDAGVPSVATLGFGAAGEFVSPDNGLTPATLLRNGVPAIPPGETLGPAFGAVAVGQRPRTAVEFIDPVNRRNPYSERFSLTVQRMLPGQLLLEAAYLATLAHKLTSGSDLRSINQVPPEKMGPGNAQALRPFPQFSDVRVIAATVGNSNYHALNWKLEKRYSRGLQLQANYTWSRFIDDVASRGGLGPGLSFANYYNRAGDRGLSSNHISHRLIWSSVYDLPFGKGRLLGGWVLGFISEFRTGTPYEVREQTNRTNAFSDGVRPNVVGDPRISGDRTRAEQIARWFNTAAFAAAPDFTFGNAGRTAGYSPGAIELDLSVLKDFRIKEGQRVQFRLEMLNFPNHANFGTPNTGRGNANFGQIISLAPGNQARIIQLGLHYKF